MSDSLCWTINDQFGVVFAIKRGSSKGYKLTNRKHCAEFHSDFHVFHLTFCNLRTAPNAWMGIVIFNAATIISPKRNQAAGQLGIDRITLEKAERWSLSEFEEKFVVDS